jgi:hypothetical protein
MAYKNVFQLIIRDPANQGKFSDYQEICMGLEETRLTSTDTFENNNKNHEVSMEIDEPLEKEIGGWFNISQDSAQEKLTIYNEYGSVLSGVEPLCNLKIPGFINRIYIISYTIQEDGNNCIINCTF